MLFRGLLLLMGEPTTDGVGLAMRDSTVSIESLLALVELNVDKVMAMFFISIFTKHTVGLINNAWHV